LPLSDELGDPVPELLYPAFDSRGAHCSMVALGPVDRMWKAREKSRKVRPKLPPMPVERPEPVERLRAKNRGRRGGL
jgi:hypothetical protein